MPATPSNLDPSLETLPSRYVVGIDLGTTNSAVSYVDTEESPWRVRSLLIPQIIAPGQVEALETLPSFHYEAPAGEQSAGMGKLPWDSRHPRVAIGVWARDEGARTSGRLIASAKSWLCHSGIDRSANILPWHAAADVERISPIEASARFLRHIHEAWNAAFPAYPLGQQDVVLTLPASFDEVARELTVEAARRADLPRVVLIEEPQAAFYAWVYKHRADWHTRVAPGQKILICDVGGGTTDFTLLRVRQSRVADDSSSDAVTPRVQFHRVAVGDHLILGGDNLDLALARFVEERLAGGGRIDPRQWDLLVRNCRRAKETLLSGDAPPTYTLHLAASGSRLMAGSRQIQITRDEVRQFLIEGFLPEVSLDDRPQRHQSGFQEFGLPYASDAAITRYLASFLRAHQHAGEEAGGESEATPRGTAHPARPDLVLFNGGFFASPILRQRLLDVLSHWFSTPDQVWYPDVLDHDKLHLAVANGAAYYGMVRRGEGVRIAANLARSYYVGVESDPPAAVCLLPGETEPGQHVVLRDRNFRLAISEPVEFPLYVSSTRLTDPPGALVAIEAEQMRALPPIRTVLRTQKRSESGTVPVELHAMLSEIGTIELWCAEREKDRRWRLQFDVRSATQTDVVARETSGERDGTYDEAAWQACRRVLAGVFGPEGTEKPERLMHRLSEALGMHRDQWPMTLLRRIWEALMEWREGRRRSPAHEARWLNLVGFALRPGYGMAVDDWRVSETWRAVRGQLAFGTAATRNESFILWRRIAGGLTAGQQQALIEPLLPSLREVYRRGRKNRGERRRGGIDPVAEAIQKWCLVASLELLDVELKMELGDMLAELIRQGKLESSQTAMLWALGRLGQRVPIYGPLNTVVPCERAESWLAALLVQPSTEGTAQAAVMQIARRTHDRYRDLSDTMRRSAVEWLERHNAPAHLVELVREGGTLDSEEQAAVFGESLPKGLRLS